MSAILQTEPDRSANNPPPTGGLTAWRKRIDSRLTELMPAVPTDAVGAAMRLGLLGPGKRLRPLLMFAIGIDLGVRDAQLMDAACAVEMVHAASLIIDDLPCMDDGTVRRGRPCVHVAYGEATAILAAVALLGLAFRVAGSGSLDAEIRARCVVLLADVVGPDGMVRGQSRDLARLHAAESEASARETDHLKTGCLFLSAFHIAATIGGANQKAVDDLADFAAEFGRAFQCADDIADRGPAPFSSEQHAGINTFMDKDASSTTVIGRTDPADAVQRLRTHRQRASRAACIAMGADSTLALLTEELFVHGEERLFGDAALAG